MLFDLQGKRKRFIQAIYLTLAILMGGGLVLFGIGGNTSGGLFDAFSDDAGSATDPVYDEQIQEAQASLTENPNDPQALVELARAEFLSAQSAVETDETGAQTISAESLTGYAQATDAWERYLKTDPKQPDDTVATLIVRAYTSLAGAATTSDEVRSGIAGAQETAKVLAEANPSVGSLSQLAAFSYYAGDTKTAEQAEKKALAEASDSAMRSQVKSQLQQAKLDGKSIAKQIKAGAQAEKAQTPDENTLQNPLEGLGGGGLTPTAPAPTAP